MAIEIVNSTDAPQIGYQILGYSDPNASGVLIPGASGVLTPSGQEGFKEVVQVSGYELYSVLFSPIGFQGGPGTAASPQITDSTLVQLAIVVEAD